jgi:hypothetical protein
MSRELVERLKKRAATVTPWATSCGEAAAEIERLRAALHGRIDVVTNLHMECERLRAAIRWALGEAPDADGIWFGDVRPPLEAKYWWRQKLRAALEPKP